METLKSILLGSDSLGDDVRPNVLAYISIEPKFTLAETAKRLGDVLGGLEMKETGRYDEYPAFAVDADGVHIALLGPPEPEADIRDEPDDSFELQLAPTPLADHDEQPQDVSEQLATKLQALLGIQCEPLE